MDMTLSQYGSLYNSKGEVCDTVTKDQMPLLIAGMSISKSVGRLSFVNGSISLTLFNSQVELLLLFSDYTPSSVGDVEPTAASTTMVMSLPVPCLPGLVHQAPWRMRDTTPTGMKTLGVNAARRSHLVRPSTITLTPKSISNNLTMITFIKVNKLTVVDRAWQGAHRATWRN